MQLSNDFKPRAAVVLLIFFSAMLDLFILHRFAGRLFLFSMAIMSTIDVITRD